MLLIKRNNFFEGDFIMQKTVEQLKALDIKNYGNLYVNLSTAELLEEAFVNGEGEFASNGAFVIDGGERKGRSPKDRFIVKEPSCENLVDWGNVNKPIDPEKFDKIFAKIKAFYQEKDLYVQDVFVGADEKFKMPLQVISHQAWAAVFANTLFILPKSEEQLKNHQPQFTVIHAPKLKLNPEDDGVNSDVAVIINFARRIVLVVGTGYAGEIKKSIFSVMNYYLPQKGVLSMHCSANVGENNDSALFFGLSGTGKTSLSADSERKLIGDDEHGWSDDGIFNFEGGCYAKVIRLSQEKEPQIYNAIHFGSIAENVIMDKNTREIDFDDASMTENTRATYPVEFIDNALIPGVGEHPKNILFLTADAFGVLPPISKLNADQAMYHFMSGYTSKLAGTEAGVTEPEATFSACFGSPFLPLPATKYAEMLGEKMQKHNVNVWLVNTGWTGGPYGVGNRIDITYTRAMVKAALNGSLNNVAYQEHPVFKLMIPQSCPNVPDEVLNPSNTWENKEDYDKQAAKLASLFKENFKQFTDAPDNIKNAGPKA